MLNGVYMTMTTRLTVALCLAGALPLSGCSWLRSVWPSGDKDVPVTPPETVNVPDEDDEPDAPRRAPADGGVESAAPAGLARADMPMDAAAADVSDESEPQPRPLTPRRVREDPDEADPAVETVAAGPPASPNRHETPTAAAPTGEESKADPYPHAPKVENDPQPAPMPVVDMTDEAAATAVEGDAPSEAAPTALEPTPTEPSTAADGDGQERVVEVIMERPREDGPDQPAGEPDRPADTGSPTPDESDPVRLTDLAGPDDLPTGASGRREDPPPLSTVLPDEQPAEDSPPATALRDPAEPSSESGRRREPPSVVSTPSPVAPRPAIPPAVEPVAPPRRERPSEPLGDAGDVEAVMLQVNERFITIDDLLTSAHRRLMELADQAPTEQAFRRGAQGLLAEEIRSQIGEALVLLEAERRLTEPQTQQIDAEMERIYNETLAEAGGSRAKLEGDLEAQGTSLDAVLKERRRRLTLRMYLQQKFAPAIIVNRRRLYNYYRTHPEQFSRDRKVRMQIIAVPVRLMAAAAGEPSETELRQAASAARTLARQAIGKLDAGEDFAQVARETASAIKDAHGDRWDALPLRDRVFVEKMASGGTWPLMPAGNFAIEPVENAAFALSGGQHSGIIETDTGPFIVRAAEVEPGETTPFTKAQEKIETILRQQQFRKLVDEHFRTLTENATIIHPESLLDESVDRATRRYWR